MTLHLDGLHSRASLYYLMNPEDSQSLSWESTEVWDIYNTPLNSVENETSPRECNDLDKSLIPPKSLSISSLATKVSQCTVCLVKTPVSSSQDPADTRCVPCTKQWGDLNPKKRKMNEDSESSSSEESDFYMSIESDLVFSTDDLSDSLERPLKKRRVELETGENKNDEANHGLAKKACTVCKTENSKHWKDTTAEIKCSKCYQRILKMRKEKGPLVRTQRIRSFLPIKPLAAEKSASLPQSVENENKALAKRSCTVCKTENSKHWKDTTTEVKCSRCYQHFLKIRKIANGIALQRKAVCTICGTTTTSQWRHIKTEIKCASCYAYLKKNKNLKPL